MEAIAALWPPESVIMVLQWLGIVSLLMCIGGIILVPWLITRLPVDYFLPLQKKKAAKPDRHPLLRMLFLIIRTILGLGLLTAGIIMLVLPGQGILTILIGISVLEFPGKHRLRDRLLRFRQVRQALNWIRKKGKQPPFVFNS